MSDFKGNDSKETLLRQWHEGEKKKDINKNSNKSAATIFFFV